ncbi:MAG TPA: FixH family protein [Taishania sp.]|nr:FixH family protein [Taishania sp.]HNS42825.1 FixH family protein [Taishania sp.]
MNWGKGLTIAMALFIGFIITLTSIMMSKSTELEDEDYYAREVNYEQEIQSYKNAATLGKATVNLVDDEIQIVFPEDLALSDGKVVLSRPNNQKLDQEFYFEEGNSFVIPKSKLVAGKYNIEILYKINNQSCIQKEEITI